MDTFSLWDVTCKVSGDRRIVGFFLDRYYYEYNLLVANNRVHNLHMFGRNADKRSEFLFE